MSDLSDKDRSRMEEDWEGVRSIMPALDVLVPDCEEIFKSIYMLGWMSGNMIGMAEGMKTVHELMLGEKTN